MRRILLIVAVFVFVFVGAGFAETNIKAELSKSNITTDETIDYKIIVTSTEKSLPSVQVPKFTGFVVISEAESSTISFVKNSAKTILVYAYILAPTQAGKFKIEPSTIKVEGKVYETDAFQAEVKQGKEPPVIPPGKNPALPQENPSESTQPQTTL